MIKEGAVLAEIEETIKKHKKVERAEAKAKEEQPFTKADMEELLNQMQQPSVHVRAGQKDEPSIIVSQQPVQQQPTERQRIAYQIWKDQKSLSIVCLIAVLLPICAILISMGAGEMYALIISFVGMVYPLIIFVKSMAIQARLHVKYGFKPLFQFQPQQPMQPGPMQKQQPREDKGDVML